MNRVINQQKLSALLSDVSTPFYVYNRDVLTATIREIKAAFPVPNFQLLFATMANDNEEFLTAVRANDVGACLNSIKHFQKAEKCGFTKENIHYTSTGITSEDMQVLFEKEITINFDSLTQLKYWFGLKRGNKAGLRINTRSLSSNIQAADRLGIGKEQLPQALEIAAGSGGIINGLHIYVGTNYKTHQEMLPALIPFFELAKTVPSLAYVNIGGGIGINYLSDQQDFEVGEYGKKIAELLTGLNEFHKREIRLIFEPGRRLAAPSGVLITKITDIKDLNGTKYVVVDASVAVFPRPFHNPDSPHRVISPFKNGKAGDEEVTVVGKTTFSKDILANACLPRDLDVGDVLLFEQAGAYCDSMRSRFLGQNEPANIFINN